MPKTTLHPAAYNGSSHTPASPDFTIHVGWSRGGGVQIATVNPHGGLTERASVDSAAATAATDTQVPLNVVDPGWFCDLDRNGINALIRELRKARDVAFGRDE